uniref:Uncharacterized protein n=1 Tax=Arundo donax TaxID=35708 RepID=A0A0A8Z1E4_ARUDO
MEVRRLESDSERGRLIATPSSCCHQLLWFVSSLPSSLLYFFWVQYGEEG